jgi:hypothetical protein
MKLLDVSVTVAVASVVPAPKQCEESTTTAPAKPFGFTALNLVEPAVLQLVGVAPDPLEQIAAVRATSRANCDAVIW